MTAQVLHVAQPTTEGVARCVADFVRHQVRGGHQVTVACPAEGWLATEVVASGAEHVLWEAGRSPGPKVPGETMRLRRIVRERRPDLLHLHSAKAGLAGRLAVRGSVPTVYQPHGWSFLAVKGALRRATLAWERSAVRWSDRIVCVSEAECSAAASLGLRLDTARVVPNGVDTERYAPVGRAAARSRLSLADGPLAVCVGRLSQQKGQDVLLSAWPAVRSAVPGSGLVLVGEGAWRERLAALAGEGVSLVGNAADPRDWYAAADVVVAPSRWEGMALVPLEAGSSGRSVVMTDVTGARETVPPGCGAVVPVDDTSALAEALASRLGDVVRADEEGAALRRHVRTHYGLEATASALAQVYDEVLSRR